MKQCKLCEKIKDESEFTFSLKLTTKDHFSKLCRMCVREKVREWRKKNPEKLQAQKRKYAQTEHAKQWQRNYFLTVSRFKRNKVGIRFDIFRRDNFTCQYCGRKSPDVILELDHIFPRSLGGKDSFDNYKTSCFECNRGKSNKVI